MSAQDTRGRSDLEDWILRAMTRATGEVKRRRLFLVTVTFDPRPFESKERISEKSRSLSPPKKTR